MKIAGKICIVFGGAQGMGRASCEALLKQGVKVLMSDIQAYVGQQTAQILQQQYGEGNVAFWACDVTNKSDVKDVFDKCASNFGCAPDIVVNCAGVLDEFNWKKCIDINVGGTIQVTENALEAMSKEKAGKGGVVIHIASISGLRPDAWGPVYNASKFAMVGYVRSWGLKKNYDITGVRFNCICPTVVDTPFLKCAENQKLYHAEEGMEYLKVVNKIEPSYVAEGIIELIENDSLCGEAMRVTKAKGRDLVVFEEHPLQ